MTDASDCDDANAAANPGESEQCDNDVDDDCDGVTGRGDDQDGDGGVSDVCPGGHDCDETDPDVNVDAIERCGDGIDNDCSGADSFCGFGGEFDLAKADARLTAEWDHTDAARNLEAGDVTGDGVDDILAAALNANGGYVLPGPVHGESTFEAVGYRLTGMLAGSAGRSVGMDDVDGDGIDDAAFGVPYAYPNGQYIVYGPITADVDLDTQSDVRLTDEETNQCGHGSDIADVNGDGYADALVGARSDSLGAPASGTVYVAFGPFDSDVDLRADAQGVLPSMNAGAITGVAVHGGRDVNGDGLGDFVVNSVGNSTGGPGAGGVYVVYGPATVGTLDDGVLLIGPEVSGYAGIAFTLGDYDNDGFADVATWATKPDPGAVYVVRGPMDADVNLDDADCILEGTTVDEATGSGLGSGDIDGDGADELLVGAPGADVSSTTAGAAYLLFDPPDGTSTVEDAAQAVFYGVDSTEGTGSGLAVGDLDSDGVGEVIIGAPYLDGHGGLYVMYAEP